MIESDTNQCINVNNTSRISNVCIDNSKYSYCAEDSDCVGRGNCTKTNVCNEKPFRRSPFILNYSSDDDSRKKVVKVKRCACFIDPETCPCHSTEKDLLNGIKPNYKQYFFKDSRTNSHVRIKSAYDLNPEPKEDEFKLSIVSLSTNCTNNANLEDKEKESTFKSWLARKAQERKRMDEEQQRLQDIRENERERQLQKERENFTNWLMTKKREEDRRKKEKEQQMQDDKEKQEEKEKHTLVNELRYQLWLKKKEEANLEKKIKDQSELYKAEEEKQRRLEESSRAYNIWLQNSKYKPKPLPMNQGLKSLKSSLSVTYVNPTPWIPNVEKPKPNTQ